MKNQPTAAEKILLELIEAIKSTGGLIQLKNGQVLANADPEWSDLGDVCMNAKTHLEAFGLLDPDAVTVQQSDEVSVDDYLESIE